MAVDHDLAASIVREALETKFDDHPVFKDIQIVRGGSPEDPHFRIFVIYDGDIKPLQTPAAVRLFFRLRPKLSDAGIDGLPIPSFVSEKEWKTIHEPDQP